MKNRAPVALDTVKVEALDTAGFLRKVRDYDSHLDAQRRSDLNPATKTLLDRYENQVVSLSGWLVLAYPGPPETTNCGDRNYHDWHLEVFENSSDHHPQIGDPTPIICEITPRTEQQIFRDNIRLHALAGFFRGGKEYQPTGHPPKLIRITGFLSWDDDHNGSADVGPTVDNITPGNGYHHPWRSTAWEIHPVMKIEVLDSTGGPPAQAATPTAQPQAAAAPQASAQSQTSTTPAGSPTSSLEFVTIVRPVTVTIPYGETVLQPGQRLEVISRTPTKVRIKFASGVYDIPIAAVQ